MYIFAGKMTSISMVQKSTRHHPFPFSNCSMNSFTEPSLCFRNCVSRLKAKECCAAQVEQNIAGRFWNHTMDPSLSCNAINPEVQQCMSSISESASAGELCTPGAQNLKVVYSRIPVPLVFDKYIVGSYDGSKDWDQNGILDQVCMMRVCSCVCFSPDCMDSFPSILIKTWLPLSTHAMM